jgi:hypothetical protein
MAFGAPAGRGNDFFVRQDLTEASVDEHVFVAFRKCKLLGIKEIHSVVGSTNAAVQPRKITADATAPGASAGATVLELTTAGIDLTATADTIQTPTLATTPSTLVFAEGDKLAHDFSGTLTGLVGMIEYHFLAM